MQFNTSHAVLSTVEKDGKAFHPTYEEKLRLVALHKQVSQGPYNPDAFPEVGFFDVLGNDRRYASHLHCCTLHKAVVLFSNCNPYFDLKVSDLTLWVYLTLWDENL